MGKTKPSDDIRIESTDQLYGGRTKLCKLACLRIPL